jgi:hypothetical protein
VISGEWRGSFPLVEYQTDENLRSVVDACFELPLIALRFASRNAQRPDQSSDLKLANVRTGIRSGRAKPRRALTAESE